MSIGYRTSNYSIATAIHVYATAPSSGDMAIDIILGEPNDKDLLVALKEKVIFEEDPQILLLSDVDGVFADEQILTNPIKAGSFFIFIIILQKHGYELDLDGDHVASFDHVVPLPLLLVLLLYGSLESLLLSKLKCSECCSLYHFYTCSSVIMLSCLYTMFRRMI